MYRPRIRRSADRCSDYDPRRMCEGRKDAAGKGSFYFDEKRRGYISTVLDGPWGVPLLLDACPFCYELLPGYNARRKWEAGEIEHLKRIAEIGPPVEPQKLLPPPQISAADATAWTDDDPLSEGEGRE
jgi:hypothetical protein